MVNIKKIAVATLAFGMLLGTGTVFANSNLGANFDDWYNKAFKDENSQIATDSSQKLHTTLKEFSQFVEFIQNTSQSNIQQLKENAISKSESDVKSQQISELNDLNQTESELRKKNLTEYEKEEKSKQNVQVEQDVESVLQDVLNSN